MSKKDRSTLEKEISYITIGLFVLPGAALTGIVTHLIATQASWQQWLYLGHNLLGIALAAILPYYTFLHIKRTLGVRRVSTIISGWFAFLLMATMTGTGLYILIFGQTETTRWLYRLHLYAAYSCLALIALHVVAHRYMQNKQANNANFRWFPSILPTSVRQAGKFLGVSTAILLALIGGQQIARAYFHKPLQIPDYEYVYGPNPFFPSETLTVDNNRFISKREIGNSPDCGACHKQIFEEWKSSIHSQAASDPTYEKNIDLLVKNKGIAAARYCEGCHAPIALLGGQLTKGGDHGGTPNTVAHSEGVSCMTCHGTSRAVHVKGNGSYEFDPERAYLFAYFDNIIARKLHNLLIRIHPEEHRKMMAKPVLSSPQLCATCHAQFMDTVINKFGWVKMQDDYSAWLKSSYSRQTNQRFANQTTMRCQDCHMFQTVNEDDPSADKLGMTRSHRWLAANTAIPAINGDLEQLRLTREFLQADRVRIHIERPWRKDAPQSEIYVTEDIRAKTEKPSFFYLGERAGFDITITNHLIGHDFPGGTIDLNEAWVSFRVVDAADNLIYESGAVDKNNNIDPKATFYYSLPVDKTGKHVWKHDLFRMTGESYRNVIESGKTDTLKYEFDIPFSAKTPLTVSATVRYRKLNNLYAGFALAERYQALPIVDMAEDSLTVPLLIKPPASVN